MCWIYGFVRYSNSFLHRHSLEVALPAVHVEIRDASCADWGIATHLPSLEGYPRRVPMGHHFSEFDSIKREIPAGV